MKNKCVVLMPASQYKKSLYRYVENFELANPKLFKDAEIQENLCICSVSGLEINKFSWKDLMFASFDIAVREAYKYNVQNNKSIGFSQKSFSRETSFACTTRDCSRAHGYTPSFGKQGKCYKYNIGEVVDLPASVIYINFDSVKQKENFQKFAYNYNTLEDRRSHLCGKLLGGLYIRTLSNEYYFAIPQIDWGMIHINQKELWAKGLYDEAVLAEMGLKYDSSIDAIISI